MWGHHAEVLVVLGVKEDGQLVAFMIRPVKSRGAIIWSGECLGLRSRRGWFLSKGWTNLPRELRKSFILLLPIATWRKCQGREYMCVVCVCVNSLSPTRDWVSWLIFLWFATYSTNWVQPNNKPNHLLTQPSKPPKSIPPFPISCSDSLEQAKQQKTAHNAASCTFMLISGYFWVARWFSGPRASLPQWRVKEKLRIQPTLNNSVSQSQNTDSHMWLPDTLKCKMSYNDKSMVEYSGLEARPVTATCRSF